MHPAADRKTPSQMLSCFCLTDDHRFECRLNTGVSKKANGGISSPLGVDVEGRRGRTRRRWGGGGTGSRRATCVAAVRGRARACLWRKTYDSPVRDAAPATCLEGVVCVHTGETEPVDFGSDVQPPSSESLPLGRASVRAAASPPTRELPASRTQLESARMIRWLPTPSTTGLFRTRGD